MVLPLSGVILRARDVTRDDTAAKTGLKRYSAVRVNREITSSSGLNFRVGFFLKLGAGGRGEHAENKHAEGGGFGKVSSKYFHRRNARRLPRPRWRGSKLGNTKATVVGASLFFFFFFAVA